MPDHRESQLRRTITNAERYLPHLLFARDVEPAPVRRAAREARRRRALEQAWEHIIPQSWRTAMVLEYFEAGVLVVRVSSPAWAERLRCDGPRLARELVRLVPGVRQVRPLLRPAAGA
jgi:hypothetical protein